MILLRRRDDRFLWRSQISLQHAQHDIFEAEIEEISWFDEMKSHYIHTFSGIVDSFYMDQFVLEKNHRIIIRYVYFLVGCESPEIHGTVKVKASPASPFGQTIDFHSSLAWEMGT